MSRLVMTFKVRLKMEGSGLTMKLLSITCPYCGARLQATPNAKMLTCEYCNGDFMVDDEVKRFRLQDAEQAGYEFEMGRQRAIKELREDEEMMKTLGPLL